MKRMMVLLAMLSLAGVAMAQSKEPTYMINVDMQNFTGEQGNLKMSVPLTFLEGFRPQMEEVMAEVRNGDHGVDIAALWEAVRDSGPTEFVQVDGPDGKVSVKTDENFLLVSVDNQDVHDMKVKVPLALCEALLSDAKNIDYPKIMEILKGMVGQDLVTIDSEEIVGRVWISK